jgi:hypothetical protein
VSAAHSRLLAKTFSGQVLAIVFVLGRVSVGAAEEAISGPQIPVPQLIYSTRTGLDVQTNPIDRLIGTYGFICDRSAYTRKPCRIEIELVNYLKTLPPNRVEISRELIALGAICRPENDRLDCTYMRNVEISGWITGSLQPAAISEELLRIDFRIAERDRSLQYGAAFHRTSKVRYPSREK